VAQELKIRSMVNIIIKYFIWDTSASVLLGLV